MKKEDHRSFFNSQDGKVNTILFFSIFLIFILTVFYAEAITVSLMTPSNISINGSANVNFTFGVNWQANAENISNCTVYVNSSTDTLFSAKKTIDVAQNATATQPDSQLYNSTTNATLSYANITLPSGGNYTWSVGCYTGNVSGTLTFPNIASEKVNLTFFIDTAAPTLTTQKPLGVLTLGQYANYTSFPIDIAVNVTDNTTLNVWYILNTAPGGLGSNETVAGANFTTLMSRGDRIGNYTTYTANISLSNFTGGFRGPGPHSLYICANDSTNRQTCTGPLDWVPVGMNVTVLENMMNSFGFTPPGFAAPVVATLNITYGNGSEIPFGTFISPLSMNMTMIFNTSGNEFTHIVGMTIDEGKMGNVSNSNFSTTVDLGMRQAAGTGFSAKTMFTGISSFIPSFASYAFGMIQLRGTGFGKMMYCNGTTSGNPNCAPISVCNATALSVLNTSTINNVISTNEPRACWLDGASGTVNGNALTTGFTYIFVRKFSGGLGANDFSQINNTFNGPLSQTTFGNINTSTSVNLINFTLEDINSTGLNLTLNFSINITISTADTTLVQRFNYTNSANTSITCSSSDTVSQQNTTSVTCNATFAFSNGTYIINVTARDTSNNSNPVNASTGSIRLIVDQIPPLVAYFNITNTSTFNASGTDQTSSYQLGDFNPTNVPVGGTGTWAQGRTLYTSSNWTDNLTQVFQAEFQAWNSSSGNWVILSGLTYTAANTTNVTSSRNGEAWANLSVVLPTGYNIFEGKNITFRVVVNDTLNNRGNTTNITVLINDTTKPIITILQANGTNYSTNRNLDINWSMAEGNFIVAINWSVDNEKQGEEAGTGCNDFGKFNTQATAEAKRNHNFSLYPSSVTCTEIGNGTHYLVINSKDSWGNIQKFNYTFSIQSGGTPPTLNFVSATLPNGLTAENKTSLTPYTAINFTSTIVTSTQQIKNLSFTSSCNSTVQVFTNTCAACTSFNQSIYPFNYTSCKNAEVNRTVTVTVTDFAGNSNSTVFGFLVDDVGPSIEVTSPTNGLLVQNALASINITVKDNVQALSFFGYYLDTGNLTILNLSSAIGGNGTNISNGVNLNITPVGTRTIKLTANDTLGNVGNGSVITFTIQDAFKASDINSSLSAYLTAQTIYLTNVTVRSKGAGGDYQDIGSANVSDSSGTFELDIFTNQTVSANNATVVITEINGSAANWAKTNFSFVINDTKFAAGAQNNFTSTLFQLVLFNGSIDDFLPNLNSYYGIVKLPVNLSGITATAQQIWYWSNESDLTQRTNVSQCTSAFTRTTTTPCWNYTSNGQTLVNVPHFSGVGAGNDTTAPTITVNVPAVNQTVSHFVPNISVSFDTVSCKYLLNGSTVNVTMTQIATSTCLGQTESFKNLNNAAGFNITFYATDASGNIQTTLFNFNVSDNTAPNNGIVTSTPSTTTATVTITGTNESVNATVNYGTSNASLGTFAMETDFNVTQTVSLASLTASTTYYYNVTVCDFNGNCKTNGSFTFTTSAAAAAAAAASSSSSSGGGSAAATPGVVSNSAASAGRVWDSLAAGTSAVLNINNDLIAVSSVAIDVKNAVTGPSLTVDSLKSNPQSAAASAKVYQYLQFTKNFADSDASKITVSFKVPKSWLTTNGVIEDDVVLYRYSESKWNALPTAKAGADTNNVLYSATTPGFSAFAIGNKEAAPAVKPEEKPAEAPAAPTAPQPEAPKAGETPVTAQPAEAKKGLSSTAMAWIAVAVIVVVAGIGYFMWQRKREE